MTHRRALLLAALTVVAPLGIVRAQAGAASAPATLTVRGLDGRERAVSSADLARLPRHDTTVSAHEVSGRYSGVALTDLLALVGAPLGDSLRGRSLATFVTVEASEVQADGYVRSCKA